MPDSHQRKKAESNLSGADRWLLHATFRINSSPKSKRNLDWDQIFKVDITMGLAEEVILSDQS